MQVLTLRYGVEPSPALRPLLRAIAAAPPPELAGLRSRYWRPGRTALYGRYLFNNRTSLDAFARDPEADSAVGRITQQTGARCELGAVEEITNVDVFDRPIFVISAPRAGSTLLYELLSRSGDLWTIDGESHGVVEGIHALHIANRAFESHRLTEVDADPNTVRALRAGFLAELRDRRGQRYLELPPCERPARVRLFEKTPENSLRIPFLRAAFPDARFVFLYRDARQNISSIIEAWHHDGFINIPDLPGWEPRVWCFLLPPEWRARNGAPLSDVAAFQWRAANERAVDDLAAVPREQWTSLEYEDIVALPWPTIRRLCAFMEIEIDVYLAEALSHPLPLSATTITPPSPIKWHTNPELCQSSLAGLGPLAGRLRNLETRPAAPGHQRATDRSAKVRFSCFLDEIEAPPAPARREGRVVNPSFHLQLGTAPLPLMRRIRCRERFLADYPVLWVEDAATRVLYPFWVRRNQVHPFMRFQPSRALQDTLDPALEARLERAGILVTTEELEERRAAGASTVERARDEFSRERYCKLESLIHPAQIAALNRYYRRLIDSGEWALGDDQVARRHGWHNEWVARFFHLQLTELISCIAGEPVKPTYSYSSAYRGGAALKTHVDRKQCEFTVSLLVDHSSLSAPEPWPLWFLTPSGRASVTLAPSDAVLFRGCELPHWREESPPDQDQIMLLFHYAPSDFADVLD